MNANIYKDGSINALCEFYDKEYQEYKPGKDFAPFYKHKHSDYSCGNPIIIGYIKTGKLAWMEQWIEVCKAENGKYGYGMSTAPDSCEGHNMFFSRNAYIVFPSKEYSRLYIYDTIEDAIRAAIDRILFTIAENGVCDNKGTLKMARLAEKQLTDITLF